MKWSELPKEYQDLEKTFNEKIVDISYTDDITERFIWDITPQGHYF